MARKHDRLFLIHWNCDGLEGLIEIDQDKLNEDVLHIIAGNSSAPIYQKELNKIMHMMLTRAQVNSHRHSEIYTFSTTNSISKKMIEESFNSAPQYIADSIREKGEALLDHRKKYPSVIK